MSTSHIPDDEYAQRKGSDRIKINNLLAAMSVAALAILLKGADDTSQRWMCLLQFAAAVPVLVSSSLAYAKLVYRAKSERTTWDRLGWFTHTIGYIMILNALTILVFTAGYVYTAWAVLGIIVALFLVYATVDVVLARRRAVEKCSKLAFSLACLAGGSVVPIAVF